MEISEKERARLIYWLNLYFWSALVGFLVLAAIKLAGRSL